MVHPESDQQWREAGVYLWNASDIAGDVRWVPDRKAYEVRSRRSQLGLRQWVAESEVAWITLANGTIWKDYRKPKDQNKLPVGTARKLADPQH